MAHRRSLTWPSHRDIASPVHGDKEKEVESVDCSQNAADISTNWSNPSANQQIHMM